MRPRSHESGYLQNCVVLQVNWPLVHTNTSESSQWKRNFFETALQSALMFRRIRKKMCDFKKVQIPVDMAREWLSFAVQLKGIFISKILHLPYIILAKGLGVTQTWCFSNINVLFQLLLCFFYNNTRLNSLLYSTCFCWLSISFLFSSINFCSLIFWSWDRWSSSTCFFETAINCQNIKKSVPIKETAHPPLPKPTFCLKWKVSVTLIWVDQN